MGLTFSLHFKNAKYRKRTSAVGINNQKGFDGRKYMDGGNTTIVLMQWQQMRTKQNNDN